MKITSTITFLLTAIIILSSCGSEEPESSNEITIDGSSTVFPITEAIAEEFRNEHPGIEVTVAMSGTGGGFKKFLQNETDINNASREIQESEEKLAKKEGTEHIQLAIGYDGLAVVVHPQNDWADYITIDELEQIWRPESQNSITSWSDVRDDWPDEELNLYAPGMASGTYDFFTEVIIGESGKSRGDFTSSEDDQVLVQGVSSDQNALGFFGLAYYQENQEQLKLLGVDAGAGNPVQPTQKSVSQGEYTPLTRQLFLYVSREAAQRENVQVFIDFYLDRALQVVEQVGYVPLADSAYKKQKEKFEAFISEVDTTAAE